MSFPVDKQRINKASPASRLNNRTCCCVPGCHTSAKKEEVSFHKFPRSGIIIRQDQFGNAIEEERRRAWETAVKLTRPASIYMRVCEKHFTAEDYSTTKKKHLKATAVPSRNLPKGRPELLIGRRHQPKKTWKTTFENHRMRQAYKLAEANSIIETIELASDTESIEEKVEHLEVDFEEATEYVDEVEEEANVEIESVFVEQQAGVTVDDNCDFENVDENDKNVIEVVPFFT